MNLLRLVVPALLLSWLISCTKDDDIVIERKQWVLINTRWQLTGVLEKTFNGVFTNKYDSLPSFRKDDYFVFKADSTYELNDHLDTMPGKNSKILDAGVWSINAAQTHIKMHSDVFNTDYNPARIVELTSTRLSLERVHPGDGSVTVTTYKAL